MSSSTGGGPNRLTPSELRRPSDATAAQGERAKRTPLLPPVEFHPLAAFLSYLIPGLGQIYQGRVGKGVLFFVCVLALFYYGMVLGKWNNVFLPDKVDVSQNPWNLPPLGANLYNRPQFAAQVWIGVAAWPAVFQYLNYDPDAESGPVFGTYQRLPYESRDGRKSDEVLHRTPEERREARKVLPPTVALRDWQGKTLNEMQTEGDKGWDLGWVLTVIAGVLNLMVIYDALAGPAFVVVPDEGAEGKP